MNYRDEMLTYIDADGLFGSKPHPDPHRSGGNQLLESVTALVVAQKLGELQDADVTALTAAIRRCQPSSGEEGIYDKNPPLPDGARRLDDLSHDDLLGVSCGSKILGMPFAGEIVNYGKNHTTLGIWIFSNNGHTYWDGITKPFHKAIYLLNAGYPVDTISMLALRTMLSIYDTDDAGEQRLRWLIAESLHGHDATLDEEIYRWRAQLAAHGGMRSVFKSYHGADHVFTRYCTFEASAVDQDPGAGGQKAASVVHITEWFYYVIDAGKYNIRLRSKWTASGAVILTLARMRSDGHTDQEWRNVQLSPDGESKGFTLSAGDSIRLWTQSNGTAPGHAVGGAEANHMGPLSSMQFGHRSAHDDGGAEFYIWQED